MRRSIVPSAARAPCRACATLDDDAWDALPLVRVLDEADVSTFVTRWRARVVEVRACAECGREVGRLVAARTA